jgi:hypothetical protein
LEAERNLSIAKQAGETIARFNIARFNIARFNVARFNIARFNIARFNIARFNRALTRAIDLMLLKIAEFDIR